MMPYPKCPLHKSLYFNVTFKKAMVLVCSVLLLINSFGKAVADNVFFNQTIRAATTSSNANQPLINQQLYGFDGQSTDPESGYQFLGRGYHRAYNPVTRRFMSQDSLSPFSKGGFNGYIFARNNPIMHQDPSGHMSTNFWINIGAILGAIVGAVLAPFTGGSTAVIAAGEVAAAAGATSGALGAAGAATHNSGLQKASLGLGVASAAIDAVNIIGSGAKLVASSADAGATVASDGSKISTTIGGGGAEIADGEDIPMQEISACFTAGTAIATNKGSQHKNINDIGLGENVLTTSPQTKKSNIATPSYDLIPITPKTWQEVDLSYHDIIDGKSYPASIKLLRPIVWLKSHDMHKVGSNVTLSIPEFGINAIHAHVTDIKPTTLNTSNVDWSKHDAHPVIGKFKRYAPVVKTYTFKNLTTGEISTINTTPNHPFYVKNKKAFVPIQDVSPSDKLVSASNQQIKLVCPPKQSNHCGEQYNNSIPVPVYNLEVYRKHVYFVGYSKIMVHNLCEADLTELTSNLNEQARNELGQLHHSTLDFQDGDYNVESRLSGDTYSEFRNSFSKNRWVMERNFRDPGRSFHANDVIREQYLIASRKGGFVGETPSEIIREGISNQGTINTLEGVKSFSPEFLEIFMNQTVNGKNTARILNDFKLEAIDAGWMITQPKNIIIRVKAIL